MQYTVLAVGKVRPPFSDDVQHYQRLLARHARVTMIEVREDEQVERRIPDRAYVSLLDYLWLEDHPTLAQRIQMAQRFATTRPAGLRAGS